MDSGSIGAVALWTAVTASASAAGFGAGAYVASRNNPRQSLATASRDVGLVAVAAASGALAALIWSLLTGNYALEYVADTTTRQGSWYYRLAGLWGGNGGSLLLWGWIILAVGVWATRRSPPARVVAVAIGGSVLLIAAVAANPFQRLQIPAIDGGGLNPILEYPAMLYHPLVLYAGHAGLVVPFALAVAGLAARGSGLPAGGTWWVAVRRATLVAWLLLGVGLVAGARWSYVELGWGGFWGWDPVENSGLLPWLAALAFLHAARRAKIDGQRQPSTGLVALAGLPFCFSLLGASLSRSGAAQSVHAFADARNVGRGLFALFVMAAAALAGTAIRAARRQSAATPRAPTAISPQSAALAAGVVALHCVEVVVTFGTVFPLLSRLVGAGTVAVTPRYYATVVTPVAVVAALLMGVAPSLRRCVADNGRGRRPWSPAPFAAAWRWWLAVVAAGAAVVALAIGGAGAPTALTIVAVTAAVLTAAELLTTRRLRRTGALVAHLGMALVLVGIAGSLFGRQATEVVPVGGQLEINGYTLHYRQIALDQGEGWQRARVIVDVTRGGHHVGTLTPGLKVWNGQAAALSQVAIRSTPGQDLIVAVQSIDPSTSAADLEVTARPLVTLVWWGGIVTAFGGIVVLVAERRWRRRPVSHPDATKAEPERPASLVSAG